MAKKKIKSIIRKARVPGGNHSSSQHPTILGLSRVHKKPESLP